LEGKLGLFGSIIGAVGSLIGGNKAAKGADKAAQLQYDAMLKGIEEDKRQYDLSRSDYAPFRELGVAAANPLGNLVGINGADEQLAEIEALKASPLYQSVFNNGRDAMLATASATGGLRGGNFQDASMRFGADTLSQQIADQIARYGGLVGIGSGATDAVASLGAGSVARSNDMRGQGAAAQAQAALLKGGIASQNWNNIGSTIGQALDGFDWKKLF
jgi:hypothetical protein